MSNLQHSETRPTPNIATLKLLDDRLLRYATVKSADWNNKGTVVILEGYGEAIEKYGETIADLNARGFSIAIFDWAGQGESTPLRKSTSRRDKFDVSSDIEDFDHFLKTVVYPDLPSPYYILSYDMGALLALSALKIISNQFYRLICVSPLLAPLGHKFSGIHHKNIQFLSDIGLGKITPKSYQSIACNAERKRNVSVATLNDKNANEWIAAPTYDWVCAALNISRNIYEEIGKGKLTIPTFFILANQDPVSDDHAARQLCNNIRLADSLTIMGAQHDILMDEDRYRLQFWAAFDAFIPGSIGATKPKTTEPSSVVGTIFKT